VAALRAALVITSQREGKQKEKPGYYKVRDYFISSGVGQLWRTHFQEHCSYVYSNLYRSRSRALVENVFRFLE
jgi:hypothetical protein